MTTHAFQEANLQTLITNIAQEEGFTEPELQISDCSGSSVGHLFRVVITEKSDVTKSLSVILKASLPSQVTRMADQSLRTEIALYSTLFPALSVFLGRNGISDAEFDFPSTVRCFGWFLNDGTTEGMTEAIVLADKRAEGFGTVDIQDGYDVHHCRLKLEKLALFHATFIALRILEPHTAQRFETLVSNSRLQTDETLSHLRENAMLGLSLLGCPYIPGDSVYERLRLMVDDFANEYAKLVEVPGDLAVLAQGNCWTNNVLFKSNQNGAAAELFFTDFQTSRICSPAVDLMYVLLMCTTKETRDKHYDSLIKFYFDYVRKILGYFGCDPETTLPWVRLENHLKVYGKIGVLASLIVLPQHISRSSATDSATGSATDSATGSATDSATGSATDSATGSATDSATGEGPKRETWITKRLNDLVTDSARWGFI